MPSRHACAAVPTAVVATGLLLAGCPSGLLGRRPVAAFGSPETDGLTRDRITVYCTVSDDDLSITRLAVEYSVEGGPWQPATIVSSTAGTPGTGVVRDLPGAREGVACEIVWDSWADRVGETVDAAVRLRLLPSDVDGPGAEVTFDLPAPVNNAFPELSIDRAAVAFTTDAATMGVEGLQDPPGETIVVSNAAPVGPLVWSSSVIYDPANPMVGPEWLLVPASGGAESVQLDADVDGSSTGTALVAGSYTAWLQIDAGTAHASPQTVTVTLAVREPRPAVLLSAASLDFECVEGLTSPGDQAFTVTNSGETGTTLYWWTSALPSWLSFSPADDTASSGGGVAAGASDTVTASVVNPLSLAARKYYETTVTVYGEGAGGEPLIGTAQTLTVRLWVKVRARIDLDKTSLSFAGAVEEVSDPPTAVQSVTLGNGGEADLDWAAAAPVYVPPASPWLTVDAAAVASPLAPGASGQVDFVVDSDAAGIAAGTYTATVEFSDPDASNSPRTVTVTVQVLPRAEIVCNTASLTFYYNLDLGAAPDDQTVTITNPGASGLVWTAADANYNPAMAPADEWLSVAPGGPATTAAGGTSDLTVSIDAAGIVAPGTYQADIVIAGTDEIGLQAAKGSPKTVQVTLTVVEDPLLQGLVAWWKLDDGSGQTATDSSGNGHDGRLGDTAGSEPSDPSWTGGKIVGALAFDGGDDYVDCGSASDLCPASFSATAWIYPHAYDNSYGRVLQAGTNNGGFSIEFDADIGAGADRAYGLIFDGGAWTRIVPSSTMALNTWHHVALTYDGGTDVATFYVGGSQAGVGSSPMTSPVGAFQIGKYPGTNDNHFDGLIDDVRVYSRVLSQPEVQALADM